MSGPQQALLMKSAAASNGLLTSLVAYYSFDSSNSNDLSGNGLNGTDTSITYSSGDAKLGANGAGATNGLITNSSTNFNQTTASISLWTKSAGFGAGYRVLVKAGDMYSLFAKDNVLIAYDWGGVADRSTGTNIADSNWHHCVISYQSTVVNGSKIYLDGSLALTTTITASSYIAMKMFSDGVGSQNATASIDEVGIWSKALTATDVTNLYNGGSGLAFASFTS